MPEPLILLVDRDDDTRRILRAALEHAGYGVLAAATGEEALALARAHPPAVVIGDFPLDVPGRSHFIDAFRLDGHLARTPILSVTARAMEHELKAVAKIADEVLLKPVRPRVVVAAVSRLLRSDPV
jgi:CheY-like chemotaxis protein